MMKRKDKVVVEELVVSNKFARKHLTSKAKEFYKIYSQLRWNLLNTNGKNKMVWKGF